MRRPSIKNTLIGAGIGGAKGAAIVAALFMIVGMIFALTNPPKMFGGLGSFGSFGARVPDFLQLMKGLANMWLVFFVLLFLGFSTLGTAFSWLAYFLGRTSKKLWVWIIAILASVYFIGLPLGTGISEISKVEHQTSLIAYLLRNSVIYSTLMGGGLTIGIVFGFALFWDRVFPDCPDDEGDILDLETLSSQP